MFNNPLGFAALFAFGGLAISGYAYFERKFHSTTKVAEGFEAQLAILSDEVERFSQTNLHAVQRSEFTQDVVPLDQSIDGFCRKDSVHKVFEDLAYPDLDQRSNMKLDEDTCFPVPLQPGDTVDVLLEAGNSLCHPLYWKDNGTSPRVQGLGFFQFEQAHEGTVRLVESLGGVNPQELDKGVKYRYLAPRLGGQLVVRYNGLHTTAKSFAHFTFHFAEDSRGHCFY